MIMSELEEKIDWEYECFYLDTMRTTKANIFTKSKEIQTKKEIVFELKRLFSKKEKNSAELCQKLFGFESVMDEAYRFILEQNQKESVEILVEKWLSALQ